MPKIHQEVQFEVPPERVYRAYMDSAQHSQFTGGPAEIEQEVGGALSAHGGFVLGRNLELVPHKRIVQAWRGKDWPEGVWSVVRFELEPSGGGTKLVMDHDAVPEDQVDHISSGWEEHYWTGMKKFFTET